MGKIGRQGKGKVEKKKGKGRTAKQAEDEEIAQLQSRIVAEAPPPGAISLKIRTFAELPLSKNTMMGMHAGRYCISLLTGVLCIACTLFLCR
jgi:hypothetical protein